MELVFQIIDQFQSMQCVPFIPVIVSFRGILECPFKSVCREEEYEISFPFPILKVLDTAQFGIQDRHSGLLPHFWDARFHDGLFRFQLAAL